LRVQRCHRVGSTPWPPVVGAPSSVVGAPSGRTVGKSDRQQGTPTGERRPGPAGGTARGMRPGRDVDRRQGCRAPPGLREPEPLVVDRSESVSRQLRCGAARGPVGALRRSRRGPATHCRSLRRPGRAPDREDDRTGRSICDPSGHPSGHPSQDGLVVPDRPREQMLQPVRTRRPDRLVGGSAVAPRQSHHQPGDQFPEAATGLPTPEQARHRSPHLAQQREVALPSRRRSPCGDVSTWNIYYYDGRPGLSWYVPLTFCDAPICTSYDCRGNVFVINSINSNWKFSVTMNNSG
jgi:hypothetical protein